MSELTQGVHTQIVHDASDVLSWRPQGEGSLQRTAHALRLGDDLWMVDPIDTDGIDDLLGSSGGTVAGVVVTLNRHLRDSLALAGRHGVRVFADEAVGKLDLGDRGERFIGTIPGTPLQSLPLPVGGWRRWWREAAIWWPETGTLLVSESLGTVPAWRLGNERLGLHPLRRSAPPRELISLPAERLLTGHGDGIAADAAHQIADTLEHGPARRSFGWFLRAMRSAV